MYQGDTVLGAAQTQIKKILFPVHSVSLETAGYHQKS